MASEKVCIIGSGNFGTTIARIIGENVSKMPTVDSEIRMWVYEELVEYPAGSGEKRKLTEVINNEHENVKYLPGFKLPANVVAVPDLKEAVAGATLLVFVMPHQFLPRLFEQIKEGLGENHTAGRVRGISLVKGIDFDDKGLVLISDLLRKGLDISVSVLMGANIAQEIAEGQFCEATIGCTTPEECALWKGLFETPSFRIATTDDATTVELCGALKNVVALGAGFCDGLGFGGNTKASIIRIGMMEMVAFVRQFYSTGRLETFFESCGVADVITTCYGGRNRKCADAFARHYPAKSWEDLEAEMLGGQKLQGTHTAVEVYNVLQRTNSVDKYPLFTAIYKISEKQMAPAAMVELYKERHELT